MRIHVVAVGDKLPAWVKNACEEYLKRMQGMVSLMEIKPEKRVLGKTLPQILAAEETRIASALPKDCELIVLDERGEAWSTRTLAAKLEKWMRDANKIAFVIGGADGIASGLKQRATLLSLSTLTLPHGLARVVLIEQLYRAFSILERHPYHRE
jgi:23S rRNA (pseudouridine1915-N3)-methyltransferase